MNGQIPPHKCPTHPQATGGSVEARLDGTEVTIALNALTTIELIVLTQACANALLGAPEVAIPRNALATIDLLRLSHACLKVLGAPYRSSIPHDGGSR